MKQLGKSFSSPKKFLLKRKYFFKIIKNIITQQFYDLTINIWVGYRFLFSLFMGFDLSLCSCFAWVTKSVSSWPTAHKACTSCLCKNSWVLLLVLTDNSHSSEKLFWDHMCLCRVWNNLSSGIPPWASGSISSFWPAVPGSWNISKMCSTHAHTAPVCHWHLV